MARTDHSPAITAMREYHDIVEYVAAADLLELHDRTSLNLHNAPGLLAFVQEYAAMAVGEPVWVEDNHA
jgi:hypothetical protein